MIAKLMIPLGILLAVVLAVSASPVMAQVPVTSPFSGEVTIDDDPAPDGSEVAAYVGDEPVVVVALGSGGTYEIVLFGEAEDVGQAVSFKVKKAGTEEWLDATTEPEDPTYAKYDPQVVNLFAFSETFTFSRDARSVDGGQDTLVVRTPEPPNWPVIGGIMAGVLVVGLVVFFWMRRRAY